MSDGDDAAPSYFSDRSHLLVCGVTGARTRFGGKTALANWLADTWGRAHNDVVIFANFKLDSAPERVADRVVRNVQEIATAIGDGETYICLSPTESDWGTVHDRLRQAVDALPEDMSKLVIHDEAPELSEEALQWFVRVAGNGSRCKSVVISQAPGDLPTSVRRQTILTWVGPATNDDEHVFQANKRGNHFNAIRELHDPYVWSVLAGPGDDDRDTYDPVPEEYAG
jgi:hypothetical protein